MIQTTLTLKLIPLITTTTNITTSSKNHTDQLSAPEIVIYSILAGIVVLITVLGNILVLSSLIVERQLRSISNIFLVSLAIADLMIGLISMPLYTTFLIMGYWPLPYYVCDMWLSVDYTMSNASVANLLIISIDRYCSITQPLTYRVKRTSKRVIVMIVIAWTISALMWTPLIYIWPIIDGKRKVPADECYIQFIESNSLLTLLTASLAYFIPVTIISVLYYRIYQETNLSRRMQHAASSLVPNLHTRGDPTSTNTAYDVPTSSRCSSIRKTTPSDKTNTNVFDTLFKRLNSSFKIATRMSNSTHINDIENPIPDQHRPNRSRDTSHYYWKSRSAQTSLMVRDHHNNHSRYDINRFHGNRDSSGLSNHNRAFRWSSVKKPEISITRDKKQNTGEDGACDGNNSNAMKPKQKLNYVKSLSQQKLRYSKSQSLDSDSSFPEPISAGADDFIASIYSCSSVTMDNKEVPEEVRIRPNRVDSPLPELSHRRPKPIKSLDITLETTEIHSQNHQTNIISNCCIDTTNSDESDSAVINHDKLTTDQSKTTANQKPPTTPLCITPHYGSTNQKSDNKAAKTLSAILLAFIITWTPYNIFTVINAFYSNDNKPIGRTVYSLGYYLCYLNSTVNPVLYAFCNPLFRRTFIAILTCSMPHKKPATSNIIFQNRFRNNTK